MGSGPGLPGIPLKIARPGVSMILAEPRGARAEFLEEVCDRLKLDDVEVFAGKVGPKFPRKVRGVITRAVASIPETLDRVADCLEPGGRMIFMKGPDCDAEIAEARTSHAETLPARRSTTPTRSPARPTTAGSSSTSGSKARPRAGSRRPAYAGPGPRGRQRGEPVVQARPSTS